MYNIGISQNTDDFDELLRNFPTNKKRDDSNNTITTTSIITNNNRYIYIYISNNDHK